MFSPAFCKQRVKIKIAKGHNRDFNIIQGVHDTREFTIIQRVHCDYKGCCTLNKKHRENANITKLYIILLNISLNLNLTDSILLSSIKVGFQHLTH